MPVQNSNVSGDPFGIDYAGPFLTWKILNGVTVFGEDAGVFSEFVNSKLVNKGTIESNKFGIYFNLNGDFGKYIIINKKNGDISGNDIGVAVDYFSGSAYIDNQGKIFSHSVGVYTEGSSNAKINNEGKIFGGVVAVYVENNDVGEKGVDIDNYHSIKAFEVAILIDDYHGQTANIMNASGAKIQAPIAIYSDEQLKLKNDGKIKGHIVTEDGTDKVVNKKKIVGDVWLGDGNDVMKNKGDAKTEGLMDGSDGNDRFVLGDKTDKILFDSTLDSTFNVDRIRKFESGNDMLYLDEDYFTSLMPGQVEGSEFRKGTSAQDANDYLVYNKKTGELYYDEDGFGGASQTKFAQFDPGTKLKASDIMVGEFTPDFA